MGVSLRFPYRSPLIRNKQGLIVGAAKIARDITERRQAEEQKNLLIREMDHRVKNLFRTGE